MNWLIKYRNDVLRTIAPLDEHLHIVHMNAGIITEYAEVVDLYKKHIAYGKPLDMKKVQEEWADTMFYLMGKLDKDPDVGFIEQVLSTRTVTVQNDNAKMLEFLIADTDVDLRLARVTPSHLNSAIVEWLSVADMIGFDTKEACEKNIEKLKVRFPEKFDADKAINRDTSKESEVL